MVNCEQVLQQLSDFLDADVEPGMRREIEEHLKMCSKCSVLHDTLRKVLIIVGDDRTFEVPTGFSERLHSFISKHL